MDKILADNIKYMLIQHKKKQSDLAAYLDVDPITVNRWLNLKRTIKSAYLPQIAEFLQMPIGELYNMRLQDERKSGVTYSIEYHEYRQMVMEQADYYRNVIDEERTRRKEVEVKLSELEDKRDELIRRLEELSEIRILLKELLSRKN
jgi:transcriptional regulator with XRE-family HTH domain